MNDDTLKDRAQANGPTGITQQTNKSALTPAGSAAAEQLTLRVAKKETKWYQLSGSPQDKTRCVWYAVLVGVCVIAVVCMGRVIAVVCMGRTGWLLVVVTCLGGVLLVRYVFRRLAQELLKVERDGVQAAVQGPRLEAVGEEKELQPLADLPDVPFEALIVRRAAFGNFGSRYIMPVLCDLMPLLCIIPALMVIQYLTRFGTNVWLAGLCVGVISYLMYAMVPGLWFRLFPTYYRVVPGRLDVLRGSPFAGTPWVRERHDLRNAQVIAHFDEDTLYVYSPGRRSLEIDWKTLSEPEEFVKTVFQAAVCTHPAPPLPDDTLLG